jgi:prepilin-type N-terminal cleavage/methylation domain-containing protein
MELRLVRKPYQGFTLIELSIVLVIIGLIIGGILVGRDLVMAAGVRAQVTQMDKYQQAINVFRDKYGQLPGDISDPDASRFGFVARGPNRGQGDGNGLLEANPAQDNVQVGGGFASGGETAMFWVDLSTAHLIDSSIAALGTNYPSPTTAPGGIAYNTIPNLDAWLPAAKIGQGNYLYPYSSGAVNYYGMSSNIAIGWALSSTPALSVRQAASIDAKIDDGLPQNGRVLAQYMNYNITHYQPVWAAGGGVAGTSPGGTVSGSSTTCYDNAGSSANPMQYSMTQNNGANVNCALSFRIQ